MPFDVMYETNDDTLVWCGENFATREEAEDWLLKRKQLFKERGIVPEIVNKPKLLQVKRP